MSSIAPSLYFPPHAAAATPSTISPPPDNDVLIMRLLGQQIALQSHSHAVENCCCLGAPTPLCVSGRLTLASCWEQCSGTRAGALSLYNCSAAGETGAALCYEPHTGGGGRVGWGAFQGWCQTIKVLWIYLLRMVTKWEVVIAVLQNIIYSSTNITTCPSVDPVSGGKLICVFNQSTSSISQVN